MAYLCSILAAFLLQLLPLAAAAALGVRWGSFSSDPLPPSKVMADLLLSNGISRASIPEADPLVMESLALAGRSISVTVGIPNEMLPSLNSSLAAARRWVHDNVTRYASSLNIRRIAVGDEPFLLSYGQRFQRFVVGAASNIQRALTDARLAKEIKVVVPINSDAYQSGSILPSRGRFRTDLNKTMIDLLSFLSKHGSPFMTGIDVFSILQQNKNFSLSHALFNSSRPITDGHNKYLNVFDATIDALVTSLANVGFGDMDIIVGKIGWPTDGAPQYAAASIAETFMKGLLNHIKLGSGTPLRPKRFPVETFIFSLLDEDKRSIAHGNNFERHWGIFTFDGQAKYNVDLGQGSRILANARNVEYLPWRWCVVDNNKDMSNVSAVASEACLHADCTALSAGGSCANISWPGNISYAFNSYYQQHDQIFGSCDFGGLGLITSVDPSDDECRFPIGLGMSESASIGMSAITRLIILIGSCFSASMLRYEL